MRQWLFAAAFLVCLVPFIRRPWLFDDPSVIVSARAAAKNPWRPYNYTMDLGTPGRPNWAPGEGPAYTHPVLSSWLLGAVIKLFGESEPVLHLTLGFIALAALGLAKKIAQELNVHDDIVGYLFAFSPVMFLTSLTLYPHLFYLVFYLLSIWIVLRPGSESSLAWMIALGCALTLAFLSLDHWPVLIILLGVCVRIRSVKTAGFWPRWSIPFVLAAALSGAWCFWEVHWYGVPHFWANIHVRAGGPYPWRAAFLPAAFMSGGLPFVAVGWPYLARRSPRIFWGLLILFLLSWGLFSGPGGGFSRLEGGLLAVDLASGVAFLSAIVFLWKESPLGEDRLVIGWFFIEFLFIQRFLAYPSGHHLLMLALPAVLISVRMAQSLRWTWNTKRLGCFAMVVLTLLLAHADQEEAKIGPRLVRDVVRFTGPRYYWGNDFSGFCYYLKEAGWKAYDVRIPLRKGEVVLVSRNFNVAGPPMFLSSPGLRFVGIKSYRIDTPLRTFSLGDSAGWYSASWGALPYSFSSAPAETFFIYSGT